MSIRPSDLPEHLQYLVGNDVKQRVARRNKYGAQSVVVDDIRFDSQKEARFYGGLKIRQAAGDIQRFHRQPIFDLPGGVTYRPDFLIVNNNGALEYIDVKSAATAKDKTYRVKKKQTEAIYNVAIREA